MLPVTLWLAIYIKTYLKEKEELWKFKYFTMQNIILKKNPLKEIKILQNITTITNFKFQHKPKISSFKNALIKIDLLPWGQNPLSYYTL
jgi:hypothetical protein